jgi:hypothetical protein
VIKLVLPKPKPDEKVAAAFFKKARRKTFDLAILNAAFFARLSPDSRIEAVQVTILPKVTNIGFKIFEITNICKLHI